MTWVRLDDSFPEHGKVERLSDAAFRLHVSALCYCARNLTDGVVEPRVVRRVVPRFRRQSLAELLAAGLWHERGDGAFEVHDFLDYNPSSEQVKAEREAARERMRRRRGSPKSSSRSGEVRANNDGGSGELREKFGDPVPSRPDPTHSRTSPPPLTSVRGESQEEEEEAKVVDSVSWALAERALEARSSTLEPVVDRARWLYTTSSGRALELGNRIVELHRENPDLDVDDLADLVEPDLARPKSSSFDPDCPECAGVTYVHDDERGGMVPCPRCRPEAK